jgi:hypothetical protein
MAIDKPLGGLPPPLEKPQPKPLQIAAQQGQQQVQQVQEKRKGLLGRHRTKQEQRKAKQKFQETLRMEDLKTPEGKQRQHEREMAESKQKADRRAASQKDLTDILSSPSVVSKYM